MTLAISNNVETTLNTAINGTATSIIVDDATAPFRNFPNGNGYATLVDNKNTPAKLEIVQYTGVTDNGNGTRTLTGVTRGREGTTGQSFSAGAVVYQAMTVASHQLGQLNPFGSPTFAGITIGGHQANAAGLDLLETATAAAARSVLGLDAASSPEFAGIDVASGGLFVDGSLGRVGIGTDSPGVGLDVITDHGTARFRQTDSVGNGISLLPNSPGFTADRLQFSASTLRFVNGTGTEVVRLGNTGVAQFFHSGAERVRIDTSVARVTISSSSSGIVNTAALNVLRDGNAAALALFQSNGRPLSLSAPDPTDTNSPFVWATSNAVRYDVDSNPAFLIQSDGSVAIGSGVATEKLDVDGAAKATRFYTTKVTVANGATEEVDIIHNHGFVVIISNTDETRCAVLGGSNGALADLGSGSRAAVSEATPASTHVHFGVSTISGQPTKLRITAGSASGGTYTVTVFAS